MSSERGSSRTALPGAIAVAVVLVLVVPSLLVQPGIHSGKGATADGRVTSSWAPGPRIGNATTEPPVGNITRIDLTYDSADGYPLLVDNGTWAFHNGEWHMLLSRAATPALLWPKMTYDAADGYVLLVGDNTTANGYPFVPAACNCFAAWAFKGGNWTQLPLVGTNKIGVPPNVSAEQIAYDVKDGYVVLITGASGQRACSYYCPVGGYYVFTGGTWSWNSGTSSGVPLGMGASMAYDSKDGYLLLFGGTNISQGSNINPFRPEFLGARNGTWRFAGGNWTQLAPATTPPGRWLGAMAFDSRVGAPVLFGGQDINGQILNDTWKWSKGNWVALGPNLSPHNRTGSGITAAGGRVLLFGGWNSTLGNFGDTWALKVVGRPITIGTWARLDLT